MGLNHACLPKMQKDLNVGLTTQRGWSVRIAIPDT